MPRLILLAGLTLAYGLTMRPGANWTSGDFALYLMHAQNLAHLRAYAPTPFVYDAIAAIASPPAYPPGYPVLAAPLVALFGLWLVPLKWLAALLLAGTVLLAHRLTTAGLPRALSGVVLAALALAPGLVLQRDEIGSDIAFCLWTLASLLAADRRRPLALGLCCTAAALTRTVGLSVPLAILLWLLTRDRPTRRRLAPALAAALLAILVLGRLTRADAGAATYLSYFDLLRHAGLLHQAIDTVTAYAFAVVAFLGLSLGRLPNALALLLLLALAGLGYATSLRRPGPAEIFAPLYLAILLVYPVHSEPTRYALPILVLLPGYLARGAHRLARATAAPGAAAPALAAALALCILPFYAVHDAMAPPPHQIEDAESRALFAAIARLPDDAPILTRAPRVLALYTGHRAVFWIGTATVPQFRRIVAAHGIAYVLAQPDLPAPDHAAIDRILAATPTTTLYESPRFRLLRLTPAATPGR